jgi:hypothetical protein
MTGCKLYGKSATIGLVNIGNFPGQRCAPAGIKSLPRTRGASDDRLLWIPTFAAVTQEWFDLIGSCSKQRNDRLDR